MNFKELKHSFLNRIDLNYSAGEASTVFFMVLEHIKQWNRNQFYINIESEVNAAEVIVFEEIISQLIFGEPIQYILSSTFFYGSKFKVNSSVLIPRPETEELVDWMISKISKDKRNVLDIGTGSGCIAISLKKHRQLWSVIGLDISSSALDVARDNAKLNAVEVAFIKADILNFSTEKKFDVIVSNPPYVKEQEKMDMHFRVLNFEPHVALFVRNEKPLLFYNAIADFAKNSLNAEGLLFFEINENLGAETVDMLSLNGFIEIQLKQDMQGKNRMICCKV